MPVFYKDNPYYKYWNNKKKLKNSLSKRVFKTSLYIKILAIYSINIVIILAYINARILKIFIISDNFQTS
jgi:hypothetical protein